MQVFVFEGVLRIGRWRMAVIVAESLERAQRMASKKFPNWEANTFESWLAHKDNEGFCEPEASYPTSAEVEALHYVYGGG